MTLRPIRRHRGLADDVVGGIVTFVIEVAVVAGLGLVGILTAFVFEALI